MTWALEASLGGWDPVVRAAPFALGLLLLIATAMSIVRTMVIPRSSASFIYALILRSTDATFRTLARTRGRYVAQDRILAWSGAVGVIIALVIWLILFVVAYSLMIFGVSDASPTDAVLQAGSGLLTLGLVGTPNSSESFVDFMAAMTGPAVIALLIGFLPTLYGAYLGRESRVLLNSNFSGAPAWGPELLARVQMLEGDGDLPSIYRTWLEWSAQVRLTQSLYPALNRFRSPVPTRHWLISLLAVLDSAALRLAISSGPPEANTVGVLEEGSQAILALEATEVDIDAIIRLRPWQRRVDTTLGIFGLAVRSTRDEGDDPVDAESLPTSLQSVARAVTLDSLRERLAETDGLVLEYGGRKASLSRADFDQALAYLRSAGVSVERSDDDAYTVFCTIRGRYETAAYSLAQRFYAPRAPWSGPRSPDTPVIWPALAAGKPQA